MAKPVDQAPDTEPLSDQTKIEFTYQTFGDLKRVFGPKRAASLLRAHQRKEAGGNGEILSEGDIDVALRFLRGEKTGAQSSKALRAFKSYFASSEQRRKACETYLLGARKQLSDSADRA